MIKRNILFLIFFLILPLSSCSIKKQAINTSVFQKEKIYEEKKTLKFLEKNEPKNLENEVNNTAKILKKTELKKMKVVHDKKEKNIETLTNKFYLNFAFGIPSLENYDVYNTSTNEAIWDDRYTELGRSFEIGLGYDFGKVRTEISYAQETGRFDEYLTYFDKSITKIDKDRGKLHKNFYTVNSYYDFRENKKISPFIGFGLGFVNRSQDSAPFIPAYVRQVFFMQLKGGISYKISDKNYIYIEGFRRDANSHTTSDGLGTDYTYKANKGFDSSGLQIGFRKIL